MSSVDQNIISVTRTIYGTYLQTLKTLGLPFTLIDNTTLNERFDVQAGIEPPVGTLPAMRYMAIGNLGHATVKADDGSDETVPVSHSTDDAGLYNQIPFVLRPIDNDLPAYLRDRYALRVQEEHDGEPYFAYYLRRVDMNDVVAQLQQVTVVDGVTTVVPFTPTTDNLNPTRPNFSNTGTILGSSSSKSASAVIDIVLDSEDIAEILNAHKVRTGSTRSPVISELALVSGVDKPVQGSAGGANTFTYQECIAAQVNVFISTYHALGYASDKATFTLDVGGVEPMLGEDDAINATIT